MSGRAARASPKGRLPTPARPHLPRSLPIGTPSPAELRLLEAAERGDLATLDAALAARARPDIGSLCQLHYTPLLLACGAREYTRWCIKRQALKSGNDAGPKEALALSDSVQAAAQNFSQRSRLRAVKSLLAAGAELRLGYRYGTALHIASTFGYVDIVQVLLARGAEVGALDHNFSTALHGTAVAGSPDTVAALVQAGVDLDIQNNEGITALMVASGGGSLLLVDALLQNGARADAVDEHGRTALIIALLHGHAHIASRLFSSGVVLNINANMSAWEYLFDFRGPGMEGLGAALIDAQARESKPNSPPPTAPKASIEDSALEVPTKSRMPSAPAMPAPAPAAHGAASWVIQLDDVRLGEELGGGSFGKVYAANWCGTEVAVKVFKPEGGSAAATLAFSAALLASISAEAGLLAALRHPHIVAFYGVAGGSAREPPCVVTEFCARGSLSDVLRAATVDHAKASELTWRRRLRLALDAAAGVLHLHGRAPPILHRDLKSPNLLVTGDWRCKVADLGLSKLVDGAAAATTAGGAGNPRWVAPEVMGGDTAAATADVFAFGVVLWELLTWQLPWANLPGNQAFSVRDIAAPPAAGADRSASKHCPLDSSGADL